MVVAEKFNFNTFRMSLNFLQNIYNGKISLKQAEFKQKDLEKEIEELVLTHANSLLESRNKIINGFKNGTLLSKYLKKSDDAVYDFTLKVVNKFIEEIKLMGEKINLSLCENFFGFSLPADYAKELINTKNADKNKGIVEEIEDRISDLEDRIKQMSDKEKEEKNANETLEIINKILGYNKNAKFFFHCASKVDKKKNQNQRLKKVLQKG